MAVQFRVGVMEHITLEIPNQAIREVQRSTIALKVVTKFNSETDELKVRNVSVLTACSFYIPQERSSVLRLIQFKIYSSLLARK